jgi:hypothetical protein
MKQPMKQPMRGASAICGLGSTDMGRVQRDAEDLAAEGGYLALADGQRRDRASTAVKT